MRVTIVNQFYAPDISPTAKLAASLAEHRAAAGDTVTVIAGCGSYVPGQRDTTENGRRNPRVYSAWSPQLGKGNLIRRLIDCLAFYILAAVRLLRVPQQDVIITMTTPPFALALGVLYKITRGSTRLILWNMDCYPEVAERLGVIRSTGIVALAMRALNRFLYRYVDDLICLDGAMRDLLVERYQPKNTSLRTAVIPNWESAEAYPRRWSPKTYRFDSAHTARRPFVVLYTGNMGLGHNFETVLDAAEQLRDEPVLFLFNGGGKRWDEIDAARSDRHLTNVQMQTYVPRRELVDLMANSDLALITLRNDMLGVMSPSKLHANLAMGMPIVYVGPAGSNVDHAIETYGCGASLRHGEANTMTQFIRRCMARPAEVSAMKQSARRAFDTAYSDRCTLPEFDGVLDGTPARLPEAIPAPGLRRAA